MTADRTKHHRTSSEEWREDNADRIAGRAGGLDGTERTAGSDDRMAQAEAILAESDARECSRTWPDEELEQRSSDEIVPDP